MNYSLLTDKSNYFPGECKLLRVVDICKGHYNLLPDLTAHRVMDRSPIFCPSEQQP